MRVDLAAMARRSGYRRAITTFRAIKPPLTMGEELARIYLENVKVWKAAAPGIIAEYSRALAGMRHDRAPAVQSQIDQAEAETNGPHRKAEISAAIAAFMFRFERWHRLQWIVIIKRTTVDLTHIIGPHEVTPALETALARSAALIKDISAETAGKVSDAVFRGMQAGSPVSEVAAEIQEATGFARKRSIRVAHDQLIKLSAALDAARMVQAGLDEYTWKHTPQPHPRLHHLARDGLTFRLGQPRGDQPGEAPFCRCYRVPILRLPKK